MLRQRSMRNDMKVVDRATGKVKNVFEGKFYMYPLPNFERRFHGELAQCERKGADYMFISSLLEHPMRTTEPDEADLMVMPCLFESYRRCTTTNHAERPPTSLLEANPHPEDFEEIPWVKAFDTETQECLEKIQRSPQYRKNWGVDHFWLVADWSINFGRTVESEMIKNITLGKIEAVDAKEGLVQNREAAVDSSRCSVIVPYASDVAYVQDFSRQTTFDEWLQRPSLVSFRFDPRKYVLYCKSQVCEGAVDATPLRRQSLVLADKLSEETQTSIFMDRAPLAEYTREVEESRFCLIIRGDTPSSHSFYDAVAANCIPILISDRWSAVASPLSHGLHGNMVGGLPVDGFALTFPEEAWMNDLEKVIARIKEVDQDPEKAVKLYQHMQDNRPYLLWSMPGVTAASNVLESARKCVHEDQD